jgi:hypothetical protein
MPDRDLVVLAAVLPSEWGFLDQPEPRLVHFRWIRHIKALARTLRIYHFQLGKAAG